ncbi:MAG: hypothetical protein JSS87_01525 [Acidobacteria bacterium]|nr:hypothetical protein [Acidobacteriota bacterium]
MLVCLGPTFAEPGSTTGFRVIVPLLEALHARLADGPNGASPILLAHPALPSMPEERLRNDLVRSVAYTPASDARTMWLQTAADYRVARDLMVEHQCTCCLMLGAEAQDVAPDTLLAMIDTVLRGQADLAVPCYETEIDEALLNSALIYPLTRSIYGANVRMPLPVDLAMSARMCERMGQAAAKALPGALMWPIAEAAAAGFSLAEVASARRPDLQRGDIDLNGIIALIGSSIFSDVESKAQFWQRTRPLLEVKHIGQNAAITANKGAPDKAEANTLIDSFRLGYGNLHEIWALVLPPNSLLGLKKLSLMPVENFRMSNALWVRVVYDFLLAHRLRTINRGHLLGALTPLYLAWVATYVLECDTPDDAKKHVEALALAFEADKPYLVSRWRWPDRFNP